MKAVLNLAKTRVLQQVRAKMVELGIKWRPTPQPLRVAMVADDGGLGSGGIQRLPGSAGAGAGLAVRTRGR
jgi:hypothetical protein